jgi:galactose-1-phosphate uridylyltransferase
MTQVAGFEFSSHCMINPVLPEDAATRLRSLALAEDPRLVL